LTLIATLLSLLFPACGQSGAAGIAPAPPDFLSHFERPASPNSALAAPAGFTPKPDITLAPYPVPAAALAADLRAVALAAPRTYQLSASADGLELQFVARSAIANFPDLIVARISSRGEKASSLVLYSHSLYGYSDFGVNQKRLRTWLAALDQRLPPSAPRPEGQ
jgi:uncharacterized protein (DUF1499 family)